MPYEKVTHINSLILCFPSLYALFCARATWNSTHRQSIICGIPTPLKLTETDSLMKQYPGKKPRISAALAATAVALVLVGSCCMLGGCAQTVVGSSNNDKYAVFQEENSAAFQPQGVEVAATATGEPISISASGWWAKDCYIHYGVKLTNNNNNLIARDVVLSITAYDEAGSLISEDQDTVSFIGPDSTIGFAGECGNGQKPHTVVIEVVKTSVWQDAQGYTEPLLVASVTETDKGYYRYEYTGGVTNNTGTYVSTAPISILLEDEQGNIIAGYTGSTKRIKAGRTKDYQITINTAPDHAQVEVFAGWSSANDHVNSELEEAD